MGRKVRHCGTSRGISWVAVGRGGTTVGGRPGVGVDGHRVGGVQGGRQGRHNECVGTRGALRGESRNRRCYCSLEGRVVESWKVWGCCAWKWGRAVYIAAER